MLIVFCIWQNNDIVVSRTAYKNKKVPQAFAGFTIIHISDLHNKTFGDRQQRLLDIIKKENPDIIVITGDLIDRRRYRPQISLTFIEGAARLAKVYYVCGNHEILSGKYADLRKELERRDVEVLDNDRRILKRGGEEISLWGMMDPSAANYDFNKPFTSRQENEQMNWLFQGRAESEKKAGAEEFRILLTHRPERLETYADCRMDLVFAGHAHGGQFRLPGIGGLIAPHQGLFPQYTAGPYSRQNTTMFVSRGLGNSLIPIRVFNRPQVVVVKLFPDAAASFAETPLAKEPFSANDSQLK